MAAASIAGVCGLLRHPCPRRRIHLSVHDGGRLFEGLRCDFVQSWSLRCSRRLHILRRRRRMFVRSSEEEEGGGGGGRDRVMSWMEKANDLSIVEACVVGLLTGVAVVIFNSAVHEIRDFFWNGIPARGASWLREDPREDVWQQVVLVPTCGGVIVCMLNSLRNALEKSSPRDLSSNMKGALSPFVKALAASVTLGTGNSLGPEGPSVEIGASIAKGVGNLIEGGSERRVSLMAAGSAAGIASGFSAAVAGCFFAVESVLWPSLADPSSSLPNATSMVILSAVIASVVSEVGLGSVPAFTVPEYDFRSPSELPLYLLLGILCGLVSIALSKCTTYALAAVENVHKTSGVTKAIFPAFGGLAVGLIALAYPEVLYWGFENVDILLESRPFVEGLPADLLLQLVGVKIVATSLCRASGLVGGYYAPSLFIGAATGMAYGKFMGYAFSGLNPMFQISAIEVASPQAYGLVGMAATLAGVCQVPLTSVLLLFELTQDYRIVLPLLGAVGFSSWISSTQTKKGEAGHKNTKETPNIKAGTTQQSEYSPNSSREPERSSSSAASVEASDTNDLCELEGSLCLYESNIELRDLVKSVLVSQAMRTRYITVAMRTSLAEVVTLMFLEKQSCALIVDSNNFLLGVLTFDDIQEFCKVMMTERKQIETQKLLVSEMYYLDDGRHQIWTATPDMNLVYAEMIMSTHGVNQLPVIEDNLKDHERGYVVGLLDRDCIDITYRMLATKEVLQVSSGIRSNSE